SCIPRPPSSLHSFPTRRSSDLPAMARVGQRAENEFVGVATGIMDQFASAASVKGNALLLDCRSLETRLVQIPSAAAVVVMDTGRSEEHTSELQSPDHLVCRLLL